MSEISLRDYADELSNLLEQDQAREVIPLAQYLLRRHPRYLEGYRLLGAAAYAQGHNRDAIEIFRRVLSVDPENYFAHAWIALAHRDEADMDEAIWHMMRAFEMKPDIREVRQQMRELYEGRDGRAPGRLHLNRAALARLYIRDGWYQRAVEELESEATEEADRVDLLTGLAEAHWRAGNRQEAIRVAEAVLLELPYCLKCNLLIGELYAQQGDIAAADRYLRIAQELDPENEVALELFGPDSYLQPTQVLIPSIDEVRQDTSYITGMREEPLPEWLADLSLFTTPELENEYVDWDAIIAYETHWRTILLKATDEAIKGWKKNWEIELRRATYLELKQRGETVQPPKPLGRRPREMAQPVRSTGERAIPGEIFDWRWAMRMAMLEELDQADWRVLLRAATHRALTPSDWRTLLRAASRIALGEEVEWRDRLRVSTLLALRGPADWRGTLRAATARSLAGEEAWHAELRRATLRALEKPAWQRALHQSTREALDTRPAWTQALRRASAEALAAPEAAPWIAGLRAETETLLADTTAAREGIVGQLVEGVREAVHRVQEVSDSLRHKATDALGSLVEAITPSPKRREQVLWLADLRAVTESALAEASEAALPQVQDTEKPLPGKARGALTSFLRKPPSDEEPTPPAPLSLEEAAEFWSDVTEEHLPSEAELPEQELPIQEVPLEIEVPPPAEAPVASARTADLGLPPVESIEEWMESADEFWSDVSVDRTKEEHEAAPVAEEPPMPTETPPAAESPLPQGEEADWLAEMADEFWSDVAIDLSQPATPPVESAPVVEEPPLLEEPAVPAEPEVEEEPLGTAVLELPPAEELSELMDAADDFWSDVSVDLTVPSSPEPELGAAELAAREAERARAVEAEAEVEAPPPVEEEEGSLESAILELPPAEELSELMEAADDFWSDVSLDLSTPPSPKPEPMVAEEPEELAPVEADVSEPVEVEEPLEAALLDLPPAEELSELMDAADDFWSDVSLEPEELTPVEAEAEADVSEPVEVEEPLEATLLDLPPAEELSELMDAADDFWSDVTVDLAPPDAQPREVETTPTLDIDIEDADVLLPTAEGSEWETEAEELWREVSPQAEPALTADPLRQAGQRWQQGAHEEALALYHTLFQERTVEDQALSEALAGHIAGSEAPAGAYQLLGDLYRRMGRMQDAVAQYREAIKRK